MSYSIVGIIDQLVRFYGFMIFGYVILSWFPASGIAGDLRRILGQFCEPYIGIFRRFMPVARIGGGGIDFSPIVAYFVLQYGYSFLIRPLLAAL